MPEGLIDRSSEDWRRLHRSSLPIRLATAARRAPLTRGARERRHAAAKRTFDAVLAATGLVVSAPLWAVFAAAITLGDGGPVFYRQERSGVGGRRFHVLKFRSMIPNAEAGAGAVQASASDPRVTAIGRFLRATAMDELPQLWNILRGDMSFVGPRALRPGEIEISGNGRFERLEDVPGFAERARVRPGLTGLAQIRAPRDIPRRLKFRYDLLYVRRQSFWLDVRLVVVSFWITLRGAWGNSGRRPASRPLRLRWLTPR
jgi:lipopolysaccharide/colanic/teichoic acid biosynthesis glycosyltransferase